MMQLSLELEEENKVLSPLDKLRLPKDKDLPPVIREIVTNAPSNRKIPAFVASLSPLCALCPRVRLKYFYDTRPSALLLQVLIEGAQSSGKSFAADIESLIMDKTLKAHDKAMRRIEQEYREKKKRRKANEKLEEEPKTTIRVVPPTISKTVLTKRADMFERVLGDTMSFWMFAEELAQVTDAGKNGYSNLRTLMRTAYDLGSLFGIDFASDNSYSAIVDINICSMFCATPAAIDEYYDRKAIEGGNITRCIVCKMDDSLGEEGAIFTAYSAEQQAVIDSTLQKLMDMTYDGDGELQPVVELDMSWLDKTIVKWCDECRKEVVRTMSKSMDVFYKRSSVSAFRIAALMQMLYQVEGKKNEKEIHRLVKQTYLSCADRILNNMLQRWGKSFEDISAEGDGEPYHTIDYFSELPMEFSRKFLEEFLKQKGLRTPVRNIICNWRRWGWVEKYQKGEDKNIFRKTGKK